jgi:hypothetical protein
MLIRCQTKCLHSHLGCNQTIPVSGPRHFRLMVLQRQITCERRPLVRLLKALYQATNLPKPAMTVRQTIFESLRKYF